MGKGMGGRTRVGSRRTKDSTVIDTSLIDVPGPHRRGWWGRVKDMRIREIEITDSRLKLARGIVSKLQLTSYERDVLSTLLAFETPVGVAELHNVCKVPRTKLYGTMKRLVRMGYAVSVKGCDVAVPKPSVFEWWDGAKQVRFMSNYIPQVGIWTTNLPGIMAKLQSNLVIIQNELTETQYLVGELEKFVNDGRDEDGRLDKVDG